MECRPELVDAGESRHFLDSGWRENSRDSLATVEFSGSAAELRPPECDAPGLPTRTQQQHCSKPHCLCFIQAPPLLNLNLQKHGREQSVLLTR